MKKPIFALAIMASVLSCNSPAKEEVPPVAVSAVELPYTASYSSQSNQDVSDNDLLTVLNSYKAWETGDMTMLRSTFGDSLSVNRWDGVRMSGPTDGIISQWSAFRDSLSSVKIDMAVWLKSHAVDKNADFITVWYKEIDTYKSGKIDSADWHDINMMKNGKIVWYSQYRRPFKGKQ